jgi:tetratricopeptide (TPR) repeat protein
MFLQKFELDGSADSQKTLDRARYYFMAAKKEGDSLPCHLGLGAVNYLDGKYKDSAGNYARAISLFPEESGAPARVALGLACYKLGQIDRAKACFDRAIEMDAGLTEGVVGRGEKEGGRWARTGTGKLERNTATQHLY